ncbi:MAG TPA: glycosyltransferase family A protein [Gemmatimonadaceae bacterium]|nr:glycosyltransferase family A protein [Gemmatimonadaceae bacterium]
MTSRGEPQVTVVIPCFRQGHLLAECLHSVRAQTLPVWTAVVVDDASPDGAVIRAAVEALDDPRVRLLCQPRNGGLSAARNAGIRASATPFVLCVDADDVLDPHYLERLLPPLLADPALELACCDLALFGAETGTRHCHVPAAGEILRAQPVPPNALMRRTLWERLGGYDESDVLRIGREDWEFYVRAFSRGCRAVHVAEPLYRYRTAAQSMNVACRTREHVVRRYIYEKHRALFDAAGEGRAVLASGYDRAAAAAQARGDPWGMLRLAAHALALRPSWRRTKQTLRGLRLVLGLPGPRMLRERWTAQRSGAG